MVRATLPRLKWRHPRSPSTSSYFVLVRILCGLGVLVFVVLRETWIYPIVIERRSCSGNDESPVGNDVLMAGTDHLWNAHIMSTCHVPVIWCCGHASDEKIAGYCLSERRRRSQEISWEWFEAEDALMSPCIQYMPIWLDCVLLWDLVHSGLDKHHTLEVLLVDIAKDRVALRKRKSIWEQPCYPKEIK